MNTFKFKSWYLATKKIVASFIDKIDPYFKKFRDKAKEETSLERFIELEPTRTKSVFPIHAFSWRFRLIGGVVVLTWYAIYQMTAVLYLIVAGYIVAIAIERFIIFWQGLWAMRSFAITIAYALLFIFMLSGLLVLVPFLITQVNKMIQILLEGITTLQDILQNEGLVSLIERMYLPWVIKDRMLANTADQGWVEFVQAWLANNLDQFISFGSSSLKSAWSLAVSLVNDLINLLFQIGIVLTIAVFFSLEKINVSRFLASFTKHPYLTLIKLEKLYKRLGHRLEGQLLLCVIIWFLVALWLRIISWFGIDLPDKGSLALIAWLTEFVPYIWPIIGSIPALLVAVIAYGRKGLLVTILLYRVVQLLENNIIVPALMSHKLGVSPLVIFLCMLLGASLFGFLWILFAVPIAVIVTIFFTHPRKKHLQTTENSPSSTEDS